MMADAASSSLSMSSLSIPSIPSHEAGAEIPLHVNIGSQSPSSSVITSDLSESRKPKPRRPHQNHTLVAVRICPLRSAEKSSGQSCCIRPILAKNRPTCDQVSPGGNNTKMKLILSPTTSNQQSPPVRRIRSPKMMVSPTRASPSPRSAKRKKFGFEPEEDSKEVVATSLICGTENKMRFDFDQVIGSGMSQELCYQRTVKNLIGRNITRGSDTTIVAMGHKKSGKTYTVTGGWNVPKKAGEHSHTTDGKLTSSAGILPRAIDDLFEACQNLSGEYKATVFMSFYMVACEEGGRTRDLLMRCRNKAGEVREGITFVQVKSPQGVKRLMDRVSKKRVSDIKEGRKFHVFTSFRVVLSYHDHDDCKRDAGDTICSMLTFVKLRTPSNVKTNYPRQPDDSGYNLRDLLHGATSDHGWNGAKQNHSILHRRLDDVLLGVATTIIIGCVSPLESEMEHSTDLLRLVAMATKATYFRDDSNGNRGKEDREGSEEDQSNSSSILDPGSVLSSLQSTLHRAELAAKSAQESSESLEAAATKWRSHRRMPTRESTLAAIARMKHMAGSKTEPKSSSGTRTNSGKKKGRASKPILGSKIKSENKTNTRQHRRHGPRLIREKEELKSQIGKLMSESRLKDKRIKSLEQDLASVNKQLTEEKQITGKLEDIRSVLKRKALLQERRMEILERKVAAALNGSARLSHLEKGQVNGKDENELTSCAHAQNKELQNGITFPNDTSSECNGGAVNDNLLSVFDDCFGEDSIYLPGDDAGSACSIHSAINLSNSSSEKGISSRDGTQTPNKNGIVSSINMKNAVWQTPACSCQKSFLTSGYGEQIDFFLPKLNISCLCGKQQSVLPYSTDLGLVASLLRPWQAEFLASLGIMKTEQFMEEHRKKESKLAKLMVKWRATNHLESMPKQSCSVALFIWSRSCSVAMRSRRRHDNSATNKK